MAILIFDQISEPLEQRLAVGLSQVSLALRSQAWKSADKQGLTPTQGQILAWLSSKLGEPASLSAVADALSDGKNVVAIGAGTVVHDEGQTTLDAIRVKFVVRP